MKRTATTAGVPRSRAKQTREQRTSWYEWCGDVFGSRRYWRRKRKLVMGLIKAHNHKHGGTHEQG